MKVLAVLGGQWGDEGKGKLVDLLSNRFDIVARMILEDKTDREFTYWDMYVLHRYNGLTESMLAGMEEDARQSLTAAQQALGLVPAAARLGPAARVGRVHVLPFGRRERA